MYEEFFGFSSAPFSLTPDPSFFFAHRSHEEAASILRFGVEQRRGFMLLTGEVGMGKTTLCRLLLDQLGPRVRTALIFHPALTPIELLKSIADDFGIETKIKGKKALLDALNEVLLSGLPTGHNAVVVIDEAQNLSVECLEEIRMLSNLETPQEKLLQIILVGQPELREKLARPYLRQLNQRITLRCHLEPLGLRATGEYISWRVLVAGGNVEFDSGAVRKVARYSSGIPRLINALCDKALLAAYVAETRTVSADLVEHAARDLKLRPPRRRRAGWATVVTGTAFAAAAAIIWWNAAVPHFRVSPPQVVAAAPRPEPYRDLSRSALAGSWGLPAPSGENLTVEALEHLARQQGLAIAWVPPASGALRLLEFPALLPLADPNGPERPVLAIGRTADSLLVRGTEPGEQPRAIPETELMARWSGPALTLWRPLEGLDEIPEKSSAEAIARLQAYLRSRGHYDAVPDGRWGRRTTQAVARFQSEEGLPPTGALDPDTRRLFSRAILGPPRVAATPETP